MDGYAELQVTSNFSFLRGASHPEELAVTAAALGHRAIAIADRNSLAGVVRAHTACRQAGLRLVVGARLDPVDGPSFLCFPRDKPAYQRLSRLITLGRRRAAKGDCRLTQDDIAGHAAGQILVAVPPDSPGAPVLDAFAGDLVPALARFAALPAGDRPRLYLAASPLYAGADNKRIGRLAAIAARLALPLVATNDALYHDPARKPLADVLTCIRERCTIAEAGWRLAANAERHLKPAAEMRRLFRGQDAAVAATLEIAQACRFSLDELRYDYPDEVSGTGEGAQATLARLTWEGAAVRYPDGVPDRVAAQLAHELALIEELGYAPYFLTVQDIVRFARSRDILCQGRGSAANSAVCFVLGITAVDPDRADLLFERFVSAARNEPPDIDVDFEHERREEVIQYVYAKYGRDRAGLTATVICYRGRGALRDVGKAMGLSVDTVARLSGTLWGWYGDDLEPARLAEAGLDPADRTLRQTLALARQIQGFPRHLSQHVGGFVISRGPLSDLVPVENAAMADRTVIQWDKDDLDALGILKVDVLGLGMLSCVRRGFALLAEAYGRSLDLASVPPEDPAVYDMLCRGDSLGVFQVESRAQMAMLPRLKPRTFYDLVIEVAIVRPGPIQGDMVHPYLRRRSGEEAVDYPSGDLARVLRKTLGVPLFQEQAMQIAIVGAGFTPSEADQLRRAMATFRKLGDIHRFADKMIGGMLERGYDEDFARRCFRQIEGFGTYGFPESHAASFALLVYVSSWLKCHYPAVFAAALLNSQPMGFYAPAQIVRDAREHGVPVRAPDVNFSQWDCSLEPVGEGRFALRLGLRLVKGLAREEADRLVARREAGGLFDGVAALWRAGTVSAATLETLARADAFRSLGLDRREALWAVRGLGAPPLPLFRSLDRAAAEPAVALPAMAMGEQVVGDYETISLTLKAHPVGLLRDRLAAAGWQPNGGLAAAKDGASVRLAGLVLVRQRPGSAKGVIFITIEDETGIANLVVLPPVFERLRREVLRARLLGAVGRVERREAVIHVRVDRLVDLSAWLADLVPARGQASGPALARHLARADEVRRPTRDHRDEPATLQKARSFR